MSFVEDFTTQWNSLQNCIESKIISQTKAKGAVNSMDILQTFENEKKRWFVPGQYNYAWLELLQEKNKEIAQEFEAKMNSLYLEPEVPQKQNSRSVVVVTAVICAALCLAVCHLFSRSVFADCISTVGGAIIGAKIGSTLLERKQDASNRTVREFYTQQLMKMKDELILIIKKADDCQ